MPFCTRNIYISKNVVLVGNAFDITGKGQGEEIDKFGTIIRFNSCVIEGYEKDVGNRTTHLFCTYPYYNNVRAKPSFEKGKVYKNKVDTRNFRNMSVIGIINKSEHSHRLKNRRQFHRSISLSAYYNKMENQNDIISYFNPQGPKNKNRPTAGISVLLSVVDLGLKPHMYGFTHTLDYEYRTYYWPEVIRDKRKNNTHNFEKEYEILSLLLNRKLVNFH